MDKLGRILTVASAMLSAAVFAFGQSHLQPTPNDFDGDGLSDVAVWTPDLGIWSIIPSSNPSQKIVKSWGGTLNGVRDVIVPGDYDGDGKTDLAVWRPTNGVWYVLRSSDGAEVDMPWGGTINGVQDIPVQGDYDGDGKTDYAVYRPQTGMWYIVPSSDLQHPVATAWGGVVNGIQDIPVPGDYDGDGKTDIAIFRSTTGEWFILPSSNPGSPIHVTWGGTDSMNLHDVPYSGDFANGNGMSNITAERANEGIALYETCFIMGRSNPSNCGFSGQLQIPGRFTNSPTLNLAGYSASDDLNFTGDWIAPFPPPNVSTYAWEIARQNNGGTQFYLLGQRGDIPVGFPVGRKQPQSRVVMVVEGNAQYESIIGNIVNMPYFNSLIPQSALATNYYANTQPALGDYLELTCGCDGSNQFADNLARQLGNAGRTWKIYIEDLPQIGYTGSDTAHYIRDHDPFAYFWDTNQNGGGGAYYYDIFPFSRFATDLANGALPDLSIVIPNTIHDGDVCANIGCSASDRLMQVDQWLQSNIQQLLSNSQFQRDGLLFITFDQSVSADTANGGGHVPLLALGPKAIAGTQVSTFYQHQNTLRTVCELMGLFDCPGAGHSAAAEFDMLH
jgi:hypothetical protein